MSIMTTGPNCIKNRLDVIQYLPFRQNVGRDSKSQIVPKRCGVYFFKDRRGRILYIGKAANLRNRLSSYKRAEDTRVRKMLDSAAGIIWQITDSEIEALILESRLIKKHRPPFNVMFRDDKQYFYTGFTKEKFPKIFLTHQPKIDSRKPMAEAIGPFTDGNALKMAIRLIRRIFPYCTCKQTHNNYCLNYHIGKCLGFCCLKNPDLKSRIHDLRIYRKNIAAIKKILTGQKNVLLKELQKEMGIAAKRGNFEDAIKLRGQIEKLSKVFENAKIIHKSYGLNPNRQSIGMGANRESQSQKSGMAALGELAKLLKMTASPKRIEGYDISNIQGEFAAGAMVVFTYGQPDKNEYRKFKIRLAGKPDDTAMLKEVLTRRFKHPEWPWPDLIIIDGGKAQLGTARLAAPKQTPVIALTKNNRHRGDHIFAANKKMPIPLKDLPILARDLILQVDAEAHRFAIGYYRKLHRTYNT